MSSENTGEDTTAEANALRREFTPRAVACAIVVAAFTGASFPYVVLKLGFGPNVQVVSAFLGYLIMVGLLRIKNFTRWENNIIQTAGTSAGQTAFMCVLLAAFDMLNAKPALGVHLHLTPINCFLWLTIAGLMGALMAVPMRRHFIEDENLPFADGMSAAETILVLDAGGKGARGRARALTWGAILAFTTTWFRDGWPRLLIKHGWEKGPAQWFSIPEAFFFGSPSAHALKMGLAWSLLPVGTGLLVGTRISLSMVAGGILSWAILPAPLHEAGMIDSVTYGATLRWVMWPGTGMMITGGMTALLLRWQSLVRTFTRLNAKSVSNEFPMRWVLTGLAVLSVMLAAVQHFGLGIPVWQSAAAMVLSIPLMLVSLRVVGETNWAPISTMGNFMQAIFALLAPGQIPANMTASGMTGSIVAGSEGLLQDYKSGKILGASSRYLTYSQLIAVPVGALAVTLVYPMLASKYGVGGEHGLTAPTAVKWAGFAELLSKGFDSLPRGCFAAFLVAAGAGVGLVIAEQRWKTWVPSASAFGLGMLLPGEATLMMGVGGLIQWWWKRSSPSSEEAYRVPLASGFVAGEALMAIVVPILMVLGFLAAM